MKTITVQVEIIIEDKKIASLRQLLYHLNDYLNEAIKQKLYFNSGCNS